MEDILRIVADSAPFSFLAVLCAVTNPVWVACLVSLFVGNKPFRLVTGAVTALAGAFIITMGISAYGYSIHRMSQAMMHADPRLASIMEVHGREEAIGALTLFVPVGTLALLLGCVALLLGARTETKKA